MKKRVILIGGHSKAKGLAISLVRQGYKVSAINDSYEYCMEMAAINGISVIHGDGTKPFILDEAGARDCDISIALGAKDEDNLVASQICKKYFKINKTVSLLSDPKKQQFFYDMGVDSVVCAAQTITSIIEQQTFLDEMTNIVPIVKGKAQILEVRVPTDSKIDGKKLWEITLPQEVIVGCILRGEESLIPRGDTRIYADDVLVVISGSDEGTDVVRSLISVKEKAGR